MVIARWSGRSRHFNEPAGASCFSASGNGDSGRSSAECARHGYYPLYGYSFAVEEPAKVNEGLEKGARVEFRCYTTWQFTELATKLK
jgi:hypothetical protein